MANAEELSQKARLEALEKELAVARRQNSELISHVQERDRQLDSLSPVKALPDAEQPLYQIVGDSFFSPDGILYPPGAHVRDITGAIPVSEVFLPMNEPARVRVADYRMALPNGENTPPLDAFLEASYEVSKVNDDGNVIPRAEYAAAVVKQAMLKRTQKEGPNHKPSDSVSHMTTRDPRAAPMMTNMRKGFDPAQRQKTQERFAKGVPNAAPNERLMKTLEGYANP